MSATTISAVLGKLGGIAERRSAFGELTGASSFDDVDLELGSAMIDANHDQRRRGEVVHAEIGETGQLAVVGVLDGGDWLAEVEEPVYLSGTYEMRGKNVMQDFCVAREAQVLGVSVTLFAGKSGRSTAALVSRRSPVFGRPSAVADQRGLERPAARARDRTLLSGASAPQRNTDRRPAPQRRQPTSTGPRRSSRTSASRV